MSTYENYDIAEQTLIINLFSFAFFRMPWNREVLTVVAISDVEELVEAGVRYVRVCSMRV